MKTRNIILILCLIIGTGLTQLYAQENEDHAYSYWDIGVFYTDVFCDGVWVDFVAGEMKYHCVDKWHDGNFVTEIYQAKGEAVSLVTGEEFEYKENGKLILFEGYTWHFNLKGNMGNHYIGSMVITPDGWYPDKMICH